MCEQLAQSHHMKAEWPEGPFDCYFDCLSTTPPCNMSNLSSEYQATQVNFARQLIAWEEMSCYVTR